MHVKQRNLARYVGTAYWTSQQPSAHVLACDADVFASVCCIRHASETRESWQVNARKIYDEADVLGGILDNKLFLGILGAEAALQVSSALLLCSLFSNSPITLASICYAPQQLLSQGGPCNIMQDGNTFTAQAWYILD